METTLVNARSQLEQIVELQRENLRGVVSADDAKREGFLSLAHTPEILERMHAMAPSVIALEGEQLAGYALVMPVEARELIPVLAPMFQLLDTLSWRGRPLRERA